MNAVAGAAVLDGPALQVTSKARVTTPGALSEQVQSAFEYLPATLVGMIAGVGVVTWLFWSLTPPGVMLPWLGSFAVLWLMRLWMLKRYRAAVVDGAVDWRAWLLVWNGATLVSGVLWGVTAWLFYGNGTGIQQTGLIVIVYTYCIAAVPVLANQPRIFITFAALCFVPMVARIASEGDGYSLQLAGELLLIVSLTTLLARSYRQALQRVTDLKLRADELLHQLRIEKAAADAARREAEIANRAKTQFFAAASHDLRQPLHAMGLFAEALRQRVREPEVMQLVDSVNESVDALEGLFSELLDMTRIDSGRIEVKSASFRIDDIFRKLRLHFEPQAFEKGLALRFRGGEHVATADPVLVERILRNLLANAIRYTHQGRVLVACRRRRDRLRLHVLDTGVGIAAAERDRVFEEFYHVSGRAVDGSTQRKGLGLGLAIVARLAGLMAAPLSLQSIPGRGSLFTLEVPLGAAAPTAPTFPRPAPAPGITLDGRLIVIVEDEASVRDGLSVLLSGWGATPIAFDSVDAAECWAASDASAARRPSLLIVDHRLQEGRTGIDAIRALRRRFDNAVPAIVVTGSTMAGPELDADGGDFHVMIKPVLPNRLRAMISFKLADRSGAARPTAP